MLDAPADRERPQDLCGNGTSYVSPRCVLSERSVLWSGKISLRRGFCLVRSSAWRVMDIVIGRSGGVGSLGRLRLIIQP